VLRTTVSFAAGVVVGALGRDALPKLEEKWPGLKEQFSPLVAAAVAGARDAAGDALANVARNVSETVESVQDVMAQHRDARADATDRVSPAT
jgi:hypothetical protein